MSLEIWEARRLEKVLTNGRTKPLVLECERRSADADGAISSAISLPPSSRHPLAGAAPQTMLRGGMTLGAPPLATVSISSKKVESRLFVVKSPGRLNVLESTLFKEIFGNLLARFFGIITPEPVLIDLSDAFAKLPQPLLSPEMALRPGWAVGCEYLSPFTPLVPGLGLTPALLPQAIRLYAYDLLVGNPDRSVHNTNCALRDGNLVAYDFECAFSPYSPRPWEVSKFGIAEDHLFRNQLANGYRDWTPFIEKLASFDEARLSALVKDLPKTWLSDCDRIFDRLWEVHEKRKQFELELERSLRI